MSQVIAGIYEIENEIGAGGGGTVYLGNHLRLRKKVVLKADKRTLSVGDEVLRREVDMLKELSHTYIPQVYDFVQEDGVVYTVMDFIEGESLDKLLKRGQIPSQPEVIKWACQLLEALIYLHNRPPYGILHGDIKPANIMLRPNGDVCLIDFNIALALGEDGAVKTGFSRGYASPEHYGIEYAGNSHKKTSHSDQAAMQDKKPVCEEKTLTIDEQAKTLILGEKTNGNVESISTSGRSTTGRQQGVRLDVRSDIYSLGATLYHLISGKRPSEDALEVEMLETDICSPAVSEILQKAMEPDIDMRYQSAEEMLNAFLQLHRTDQRAMRHKRRILALAMILASIFLIGGACCFTGLKQLEQMQTALTLSEYSANALAGGNVSAAIEQALQAIPDGKSIFDAPVTPQAQKALTDALGVYDLSDGFKSLDTLTLPSEPFDIAVSPEGLRLAVVYAYEVVIFEMETRQIIATLSVQTSALSDVVFLDETRIVYAGSQGVTAYDLDSQTVLWTGEMATTLAVSADRTVIAAVNRDEDHVTIYRSSDGAKVCERSFQGLHMTVAANDIFADPKNDIFTLNAEGSLLAVSFSNGGLRIFDLTDSDADMIIYEESDSRHFEGGFSGKYFAFSAWTSSKSLIGLIDTEKSVYLGGYDSQNGFLLRTDEEGIYLASNHLLVNLDPDTMEEKELAYTDSQNIINFSVGKEYVVVATDDGSISFYDSGASLLSAEETYENCDFLVLTEKYAVIGNRNEPSLRFWRKEDHEETQLLSYDAHYSHNEARISQDGQTAMLFSYQGFRLYDRQGTLLTQVILPDADFVYDQQFIKGEEDSFLKVIWYDGTIRCYSARDGLMISEEAGEKPSKDLYEEFLIDGYRIASSLHTAPEVYDLKSGKMITTLEKDCYLTYVSKIDSYIITEYINTDGKRFGILLDEHFQKLAYLSDLCDIAGNMFVFDDQSGNLRQCRLYSLQDLVSLGETYLKNE